MAVISRRQSGYLPRNVINAPEVKQAIRGRSQQRTDPLAITQWLENHFFRWVIGSFPQAKEINSISDYILYVGAESSVPDWLTARLLPQKEEEASCSNAEQPIYYLNPNHLQLLQKEQILVEFLSSRLDDNPLSRKLQRITCSQALAMWQAEHEKMQRARRAKGWSPNSGLGLKEVLQVTNGAIFEFIAHHSALREEMAYESRHMQHCVGHFASNRDFSGGYGEFYAEKVETGQLRLFTLRSQGNMPHVTIALDVDNQQLKINQIKGKQNRYPIRKYAEDVLRLLQLLQPLPERHPDCEGMGVVYERDKEQPKNDGWKFISEVQQLDFLLSVMNNNFHLIEHFAHPPAILQWLLLRGAPKELHRLRSIEPAVAAAARLMLDKAQWPTILQDNTPEPRTYSIEGIAIPEWILAPLSTNASTKEFTG
ncbi:hypothetical protein Z042_12480 [Chania multitudinisentens RB-25]|uniref:Cytoplasmic protein n=1 Tax=Chania multitudinisentens RB-25 TaxID=1441930 RepID=W0LDK3_9GAMM|nr:PcfJ domain-containing protein [Chania multitudinisentens]AHG20357.1 hypothetical protein Z042_12480 [Chania multitudinisentens RB-25]